MKQIITVSNKLLLCLLILMHTACSLATKYEQPELPVPANFLQENKAQSSNNENLGLVLSWQNFFQDEQLKALIQTALENNRDLSVAALNVEKARALYRIERSDAFPQLALQGSGQHQNVSSNLVGGGSTAHEYQANVGIAAYELDFFARVKSLSESALQQYLATEEAKESAQITLIAELSSAYIQYQLASAELQLFQDALLDSEQVLAMVEKRAQMGIESPASLEQSKINYQQTHINVLRKKQDLSRTRNALHLLLAQVVDINVIDLNGHRFLGDVPAGLNSEVLFNRPDIKQSENYLRKANANIGVARANFFPRITLTANAGVASNSLSNLFEENSETWLFKPEIYIPLFRGGANKAGLKQAKIEQTIAVKQYEKSIQAAFREVSDALQANTFLTEQEKRIEKQLQSAKEIYGFTEERYEKGLDNQISLLKAHQTMLASEREALSLRQQKLLSRIQLYKAVGGGS